MQKARLPIEPLSFDGVSAVMSAGIFACALSLAACSPAKENDAAGEAAIQPEAPSANGEGLAVALESADLELGEQQFAVCTSCHAMTDASAVKVGPRLTGFYGQPAASVDSAYEYSDALKSSDVTWDAAALDGFIADPAKFIPGNKMTFPGIPDAQARANIIAFIEQQQGGRQ